MASKCRAWRSAKPPALPFTKSNRCPGGLHASQTLGLKYPAHLQPLDPVSTTRRMPAHYGVIFPNAPYCEDVVRPL